MPSTLVRTVRFSAGHHYHRPAWSEAENEQAFGVSRFRHGHNYQLHVHIRGEIHPQTGFLVDLAVLDQVLADIVGPLDQRDLTEVVEEFGPGGRIPSTEELARWFWTQLAPRIPAPARLSLVRLDENDTLSAEYRG